MIASAVVAALFCMVLGRLFFVQVLSGSRYARESLSQSRQRAIVPAARGCIRDAEGRILAQNIQKRLAAAADIAAFASPDSQTAASTRGINRIYPYGEMAGTLLGYVGRDGDGLGGVEFLFDRELRGENGWAIVQRDGRNFRYGKIDLPSKEPRNGSDVYLTIDA